MSLLEQLRRLFPALDRVPPGSFVVGGAIRDLLMDRDPVDVDIATPDPLAAAQAIRSKVIRLGRDHLSAYRIVSGSHVYDFAPIEGESIDTDLARRDFTVNAMAVDLASGNLLDPHGGRGDIERRIVRMIRPSNFDDDPLRMLKAVRMAVRYGMTIDEETLDAIRERAGAISSSAPERITYELSVILSSNRLRESVRLLRATGFDLGLTLRDVHADEVPLAAALAILVDEPRTYGERWRWSESLIRDVATLQQLVEDHSRMALFDAGESVARQLPPMLRALGRENALDWPDFGLAPLLDGGTIAAIAGLTPGPALGRIKRQLLEAQVKGKVTTKDEAEGFVRELSRC